ncbi:MAG: thioesterase family protein [Desulfobacter sp.]|nr:thioesterase family protein [Desulfobacter sp.]WDP85596.1 MAG: thioesterase family protein [Desulfobacter sp.]
MLDNLLDTIKHYYLEWLPFNKVLGISIDHLDYETGQALTSFPMKPELIGNSAAGILHGGVTASVIDLTGGLSALLSCVKGNEGASLDEIQAKLVASATIDMRVDYLRPGKGDSFECKSRLIRAGSRVVVSKIDLFNDTDIRIATGTATYMIG